MYTQANKTYVPPRVILIPLPPPRQKKTLLLVAMTVFLFFFLSFFFEICQPTDTNRKTQIHQVWLLNTLKMMLFLSYYYLFYSTQSRSEKEYVFSKEIKRAHIGGGYISSLITRLRLLLNHFIADNKSNRYWCEKKKNPPFDHFKLHTYK